MSEETQFDYKIFVHFSVEVHYWQIIAANGQFLPKHENRNPFLLWGCRVLQGRGGAESLCQRSLGVGGLKLQVLMEVHGVAVVLKRLGTLGSTSPSTDAVHNR